MASSFTVKLVHNNLPKIQGEVKKVALQWLEETSGELESQAKRNTRVDSGDTKNSWTHKVDEGAMEAVAGSANINTVYEEYGTGEYAANGGGRQGYWVFVKGSGGGSGPTTKGKTYSLEEAKRAMAILRSKGLDAYYTKGKTPNPALHNAWDKVTPKAKKALAQKLSNIKV